MAQVPEQKEITGDEISTSNDNEYYTVDVDVDTHISQIHRNRLNKENRMENKSSVYRYSSRTHLWMQHASNAEKISHELHRCIGAKDYVGFNSMVNKYDITKLESTKWTPLMTCVQKKEIDFVKTLLRHGASVHTRDPQKRVVLHIASSLGWISIAKLLLTHRFDELNDNNNRSNINDLDRDNNSSLILATKSGHSELIKLVLLNKNLHKQNINININLQNSLGQTALHLACEKGNLQIVKQLIYNKNCLINTKDNKGQTPLQRAVRRHRYQIVKSLLSNVNNNNEYKSDINTQSNNGMTALMSAAKTKDNKMLKILLGLTDDSINKINNNNKKSKNNNILKKRKRKSSIIKNGENEIQLMLNEMKHKFWLQTFERKNNVLFYLKRYKCDKAIYQYIVNELRYMIQLCLCIYNPQIPEDIAKFISNITY